MNNNTTTLEQIQKMANGVKLAALLSLATNIYEMYGYLNEPTGFQNAISLVVGMIGTILIWLFGRELQAQKKQALFYWVGLLVMGMGRLLFSGAALSLNVLSIALVVLLAVMTSRLVVWTRNKALT